MSNDEGLTKSELRMPTSARRDFLGHFVICHSGFFRIAFPLCGIIRISAGLGLEHDLSGQRSRFVDRAFFLQAMRCHRFRERENAVNARAKVSFRHPTVEIGGNGLLFWPPEVETSEPV